MGSLQLAERESIYTCGADRGLVLDLLLQMLVLEMNAEFLGTADVGG